MRQKLSTLFLRKKNEVNVTFYLMDFLCTFCLIFSVSPPHINYINLRITSSQSYAEWEKVSKKNNAIYYP